MIIKNQKITFIGLGKMGAAIAEKLIEAGHELVVYNRTAGKTNALQKIGAIIANSIQSAVLEADIVFTSVLDDEALLFVSKEIIAHAKKGTIHVSTSTILPNTANALEALHDNAGCIYIASPVLGIPKAVRAKKATTFCSGNQTAIEKIIPLLETYSAMVENMGEEVAHANVFKVCMNYSLITAIELISELYAYAEKSGVDKAYIQGALKYMYSHPAVHVYIDKIYHRDFDQVNFDMKGGNKDVHLFQKAFLDAGVSPDLATVFENKVTESLANKMENKDWSAVSEVIRRRSGLE